MTGSGLGGVWLVCEREIGARLRSRVFVVATLTLFGLAVAGVVWAGAASAAVGPVRVAVTEQTRHAVTGSPGVAPLEAVSADAAVALVESGRADAALVPASADGDGAFDYAVIADHAAPTRLIAALSRTPPVVLLNPPADDPTGRYVVALAFGLVFLVSAATFGGTIAQSIVEEKQTRVVELLISATPVPSLLAGKVLGNTILAIAQVVVLAAIGMSGLIVTGNAGALTALVPAIAWFGVFFLVGFVLLASLFAGAGAMVSRQEDVGATTTPLTLLVMIPYVLVLLFSGDTTVLTVLSYVPFSAPVAMPVRIALAEFAWWEPPLSLAVLLVTCAAAVVLGGRVYRASILRMGGRVRVRDALSAR